MTLGRLFWLALMFALVPVRWAALCALLSIGAYVPPVAIGRWLLGPDPSRLLVRGAGRLAHLRARAGYRLMLVGVLPNLPGWLSYPLHVANTCWRRLWCVLRLHQLYFAEPADRAGPWHHKVRAVCCRECHGAFNRGDLESEAAALAWIAGVIRDRMRTGEDVPVLVLSEFNALLRRLASVREKQRGAA